MSKIWDEIVKHEGETFYTKTNKELVYKVEGNMISHNRTKVKLSRSDFEKAVKLNPENPGDLQNEVTGPSYVFAIITDDRMQ